MLDGLAGWVGTCTIDLSHHNHQSINLFVCVVSCSGGLCGMCSAPWDITPARASHPPASTSGKHKQRTKAQSHPTHHIPHIPHHTSHITHPDREKGPCGMLPFSEPSVTRSNSLTRAAKANKNGNSGEGKAKAENRAQPRGRGGELYQT